MIATATRLLIGGFFFVAGLYMAWASYHYQKKHGKDTTPTLNYWFSAAFAIVGILFILFPASE